MPILTPRTFQEEFHKLGVVNTRSENLRGKFHFFEIRISSQRPFAFERFMFAAIVALSELREAGRDASFATRSLSQRPH